MDKIITLDSPHEGTGALNMQVAKEARTNLSENAIKKLAQAAVLLPVQGVCLCVGLSGFSGA